MPRLALCLLWFGAAAVGAAAQDVPTPEQVKQTVAALDAAFKSGDEVAQVAAIKKASGMADGKVINELKKGVRERSRAVKVAAITALGATRHEAALKSLHWNYWNNKGLRTDDELFALLIKEIGRHGSTTSIRALADHPFKNLTVDSGTARVLALGNIRSKKSLDELVKLARKGGGERRGGRGGRRRGLGVESEWAGRFRGAFHTALVVLTGEDHGYGRFEWQQWWSDNRRTVKISDARPPVSKEVRSFWESYWDERYDDREEEVHAADRDPLGPPFERVDEPSDEEVQDAVKSLKESFGTNSAPDIIHAIQSTAGINDRKVVHEIARGLRSKDDRIRMAAVSALGWMPNGEALKQLHRMYRRERNLSKREELFAILLKSIGRHGHKSSLAVLKDHPYRNLTLASGKARILGAGNIRTQDSLAALMKGMQKGGGTSRRRGGGSDPNRFGPYWALSLCVLTGENFGEDRAEWQKWWRDNRRTFKVAKQRPKISKQLEAQWEAYWDTPY
ncbi:MAG: HEAT repeat domain-containing protein [Planctomycetota bacterium]|nr:HEAT repeat domain-containing protein [Planctomycetota bacterium]